jgi:hypothetical protein
VNKSQWIVKDKHINNSIKVNTCIWCNSKLGEEHEGKCVTRKKTIIVNFKIRMLMIEPESWDKEQIEFYYNDGRWCASNLIDYIEVHNDKLGCLCQITEAEYIRDANAEDEQFYDTYINRED